MQPQPSDQPSTNATDFKVAPVSLLLVAVILLVITIILTILAISKIDFSKLSTSNSSAQQAKSSSATQLSAADMTEAEQVGSNYITDLQNDNTDLAFKLESPYYQQAKSGQPWLEHPTLYIPSGTPILYAQSSGKTVTGDPDVVLVYQFQLTNGSSYYIQLLVDKLSGTWWIHGFTGSETPLKASY